MKGLEGNKMGRVDQGGPGNPHFREAIATEGGTPGEKIPLERKAKRDNSPVDPYPLGAHKSAKTIGTGAQSTPAEGFTLRVLYLFAGTERKTSVVAHLRRVAAEKGWKLAAEEIDLKRSQDMDLTQEQLQDQIVSRIKRGEFHVVICTPPCSTWSRVRMANLRGPPPLRSRLHTWGFPWVSKKYEKELKIGSDLVRFSIRVWVTVNMFPVSADGFLVFLFGEHPEDLGTVVREEDKVLFEPASIWQLQEIRSLVDSPSSVIGTVAINQCCWGAPYRKPTRLLSTSLQVLSWGPSAWPSLDGEGFYQGPLKKNCGCNISHSLARTANDSAFRTTGTDMYPPALDEAIAEAIIQHVLQHPSTPPKVGKDEVQKEKMADQKVVAGVVNKDFPGEQEGEVAAGGVGKDSPDEPGEIAAEEWRSRGKNPDRHEGLPIRCYYKGRLRTIHDGGGICSPGRWPVKARRELEDPEGIRLAACCKQLFWRWLQKCNAKEGLGEKGVFWSVIGGKYKSSPFAEDMAGFRESLDEGLRERGYHPERLPDDRSAEVNFRRIFAMLQVLGDEDSEWLPEVAGG